MGCSVHLRQHPHSSLIFNFSNYSSLFSLIFNYSPIYHPLYLPTKTSNSGHQQRSDINSLPAISCKRLQPFFFHIPTGSFD
ncbi:hypothetical protein HanRHA438_Chr16g0771961 [Helianthus annuus]|nr:hypothetical protein HanRHA438_Chr16g0771961 [Helianthus annuus]